MEWLWVGVVVCDVSVDGGLQIDDADEGPAFEASLGQRDEEPLNRVQPAPGSKVNHFHQPACPASPSPNTYTGGR